MRNTSSVIRAMQIIELLANEGPKMLSEVVEKLNMPKSTAYVLLKDLIQVGYVTRSNKGGPYTLGLRLFSLLSLTWPHPDLRNTIRPVLEYMTQEVGETAHLGILDRMDFSVVYIDKVESRQAMRLASRIGMRNPLYCTGIGKALLAFASHFIQETYYQRLQLVPFTKTTITSLGVLREEMDASKTAGYAIDLQEHEVGVNCVAVALTAGEDVLAAVSVAGPSIRFTADRLPVTARILGDRLAIALQGLPIDISFRYAMKGDAVGNLEDSHLN